MNNRMSLFIHDWERVHDELEVRAYFSLGLIMLYTAIVHLVLGLVLLALGLHGLGIYSILCIPILLGCFQLSRLGLHDAASLSGTLEVVVFSAILTGALGWSTSCQWYMLPAMMPHFMFVDSSKKIKMTASVFTSVTLLLTLLYCQYNPPVLQFNRLAFGVVTLAVLCVSIYLELRMTELVIKASHQYFQKHIRLLKHQAHIDPLTGLWNRRYIHTFFDASESGLPPYCISLVDLDHFKQINDTYGHEAGDSALCHIADMMKHYFRSTDIIVRWGGDEFLIALQGADLATATRIMESFRKCIASSHMTAGGQEIPLTVTIGVTTYHPNDEESFKEAVCRSDSCLYNGKLGGRNRISSTPIIPSY